MDISDDSFKLSHDLTIYWDGIEEVKGLNDTLIISFDDGRRIDIFGVTRREMDAIFQAYTRRLSSHHKEPAKRPVKKASAKRKAPHAG